jgi:hypothetical protein
MKNPSKPMSRVHSLMEISGNKVAKALQTNREMLVRQNMLKEGTTLEAEQASIDTLISLAGAIEFLRLKVGTQDEMNQAWLEMKAPWLSAQITAASK